MASNMLPATHYIHAAPASQLASGVRPICLSGSVLQALNGFLDELLLCAISLAGPSSSFSPSSQASTKEQSLRLPLQTVHIRDGLLAFFARARGNNQGLAREAILEAELEVREWIRTRGHKSDAALAVPSLSRKASHASALESIADDPSSERRASVQAIFDELKAAIAALSSLGARSAFHNSTGARAAAATRLSESKQLVLATPVLAVYASSIINYLSAYLVKGCARVVERDASSSEAKLHDLLELMGEDAHLTDVWRIMDTRKAVLASIASRNRTVRNADAVHSSRRPSTALSQNSQESGLSSGIVSTLLTPVRRGSLRNKKVANLALHQSDRGISSESRASSGSRGSGNNPLVSNIPFRTPSHSPTSTLSPAQQYQHQVGSLSRGSSGETESSGPNLPEDAKAYLRFAEDENSGSIHDNAFGVGAPASASARSLRSGSQSNPRSNKASGSNGRQSTSTEVTATGADDDEFESLLAGKDTLKMSLTPSRFRFGSNAALSSETNEFGGKASPSMPTTSRAASKPVQRFQARSAKPAKSGLAEDSTEDSETLDEEDEELLGLPKRRQAKKESLMDMLNSEPPWAAGGGAPPPLSNGRGLSKAERMMGASSSPAQSKVSTRPRGRTSPTESPVKFAPISNLDALGSFGSVRPGTSTTLRPGTGVSTTTAADSIFASSTIDFFREKAGEFPEPPSQNGPGRLQSHKSSPNLSRALAGAESGDGYAGLSPMPKKRLVAKDERSIRAEKNDDLLDFFKNTPPPPPTSLPFDAANEPTTPSNASFGGKSSRSSKLKGFLSPTIGRKGSQAPLALPEQNLQPTTQSNQSSSMFRMPSLPRARQGSRDLDIAPMIDDFGRMPRKLSKTNGIMRTGSTRSRQTTAEKQEELNLPATTGNSQVGDSAVGAGPSKYVFPDIFGTTSSVTTGHDEIASAVGPASVPLLTPDNSRDSLFKIATGRTDGAAGQLSPPLSTGRSLNPAASHYETPLQTPPATPQEKRVPAFPSTLAASDIVPEMRRTASDGVVLEKQHRRQSSLVKRKPSPRIEEEEELNSLYGSSSPVKTAEPVNPLLLSAVIGARKGSVASTSSSGSGGGLKRDLSVRSTGSSYHPAKEPSRSREASANSFISVSSGSIGADHTPTGETASAATAQWSGAVAPASPPTQEISIPAALDLEKEEMEVIPTPLYTAQSYFRASKLVQRDGHLMSSSGSRPVSAILVPGSYAGKGGKPDTHDILLSLRNEMLGAQNVADCLDLLDNAMFEIAYEIKSAAQMHEPIIEEEQEDDVASLDDWAPAGICENRAFLAILEFIVDPAEVREEDKHTITEPSLDAADAIVRRQADLSAGPSSAANSSPTNEHSWELDHVRSAYGEAAALAWAEAIQYEQDMLPSLRKLQRQCRRAEKEERRNGH